jgi:hypothetical protein
VATVMTYRDDSSKQAVTEEGCVPWLRQCLCTDSATVVTQNALDATLDVPFGTDTTDRFVSEGGVSATALRTRAVLAWVVVAQCAANRARTARAL